MLERLAAQSTVYLPRKSIVAVCKSLSELPTVCHNQGIHGFIRFKQEMLVDSVAKALAAS